MATYNIGLVWMVTDILTWKTLSFQRPPSTCINVLLFSINNIIMSIFTI